LLSIKFNNVYINDYYSIVGKNEKEGNITKYNGFIKDFYYGEKSFELAQIKMQREAVDKLLINNDLIHKDIDLIIGGDLLNQITGTTYAIKNYDISFLGIYSACSSFIQSLIIASTFLQNNNIKKIVCITGSHNLTSERQFRYPVEYGAIRNVNSTFTATGAIASLITNCKSNIKIIRTTIGRIIDFDINDPNMIGAIMAPAAAEVIVEHLNNNNLDINYYDLIITGDLGNVGLSILKDYLEEEFHIVGDNIIDAGSKLYKNLEDVNDGASGPLALPLYFFYNILHRNKYKKILLVGTGSLHSSTMVNQKESVPSIAHALELEII
jgi:stage V sporulation protein AD